MKKIFIYGISVIIGFVTGTVIYQKTKEKQRKARKEHRHIPYGPYEALIKRPLDIIISGTAIVLLSSIMLIIGIQVKIKIGTPVLFKQERPGKDERLFTIFKFRTMLDKRDEKGRLFSDKERLTDFGSKLRSTSLDELPELINILKGDMSIVGPRPQLVRDMVFMSDIQRKRHEVLPGLTGLAQVSGRNGISWKDKLDKDLEYIEHITFKRDVEIILKTFKKVINKDGINEDGQATALDYGDYLLVNGQINQEDYNSLQIEAIELLLSNNNINSRR